MDLIIKKKKKTLGIKKTEMPLKHKEMGPHPEGQRQQEVEQNLTQGHFRQAWQSIKAMSSAAHKGRGKTNIGLMGEDGLVMAHEFNVFFSCLKGKLK